MEIEFSKILYLVVLMVLIFGIMTSAESYTSSDCRYPSCSAGSKIPQFRTVVKDFNCLNYGLVKNAFDDTNRFTLSVILDVSSFSEKAVWQRLFNAGNNQASRRTPGVWIRQGHLHIRASTNVNWNEGTGCVKVHPPLEEGVHYHLVLVYDRNRIDVYMDGQKIRSCSTQGVIRPERDLHLGLWENQPGANINLTLSYLPQALSERDIRTCWLYIKDEIKSPMPITSPSVPKKQPPPPTVSADKPFPFKTGDVISLRSHHKKYLVAESDGNYTVRASSSRVGPSEKWTVQKTGPSQIALRSQRNRYLVSEPNYQVRANRERAGPWEKWQVDTTGKNEISLRSWKERYLVAEPSGAVKADRTRAGPWERWNYQFHKETAKSPTPKQTTPEQSTNRNVVTIYMDRDFRGRSKELPIGRYSMGAMGLPNDSISSLRVTPGYRATLYQHASFQGAKRVYTSDTPSLPGFDNQTSSIVVEKA